MSGEIKLAKHFQGFNAYSLSISENLIHVKLEGSPSLTLNFTPEMAHNLALNLERAIVKWKERNRPATIDRFGLIKEMPPVRVKANAEAFSLRRPTDGDGPASRK
jgi:hypothetical protein